jgi:hypothetical protein
MSLFKLINDEVDRHIRQNKMHDDPDTRILVLYKLKEKIEKSDLDTASMFKAVQAIDSEICVQRVRRHLKQLPLF